MWSIFKYNDPVQYGGYKQTEWERQHGALVEYELYKIVSYYRARERRVNNNHELVRMLRFIVPLNGESLYSYIQRIEDTLNGFLRHFGITSHVHRGMQYGSNRYLYFESDYDLSNIDDFWMDAKPVQVIYTDHAVLSGAHPEDIPAENTVYLFDPKLMAIQFYKWLQYRGENDMPVDPAYFVYQYLLTNAIDTHFNYGLFNTYTGQTHITTTLRAHPFHTRLTPRRLEAILKQLRQQVNGKGMYIQQHLRHIPVAGFDDFYIFLVKGNQFVNRYNRWLWFTVYASILNQVIRLGGMDKMKRRNRNVYTESSLFIRMLRAGRELNALDEAYLPFVSRVFEIHDAIIKG